MEADPELGGEGRDRVEGFDFLIVDGFLRDLVSARALKTALELQLVDLLLEHGELPRGEIAASVAAEPAGVDLLLDLLLGCGVLEEQRERVRLAVGFRRALAYRDLLEARLDFAGFVTADFMELFSDFVRDHARFRERSRLFRLFDYQKAVEPSAAGARQTRIWVDFTTVLSRYEAQACLRHYDFSAHRRMLDVGGNSGEFALQLCRAAPGLEAVVLDLPVVCEIGQQHLLLHDERDRVRFLPADAFGDPWPGGFDLVCWKSMLHDWPDERARELLARARHSLVPDGRVMIFERGPMPLRERGVPFSQLPILLFARSYRPSSWYRRELEGLGYRDIEVKDFELETPFFLITARAPGGR